MDEVILVDEKDNAIGRMTKLAAHRRPHLHRAFSVFICNDGKMLLQKRAAAKYHSAGLWSNACCSHPRPGESVMEAARRRLAEECGIGQIELRELFSFTYFHSFANGLYEYEYDHVLYGEYEGEIKLNKEEASAYAWVDFAALESLIRRSPSLFSVWFLEACPRVTDCAARPTP